MRRKALATLTAAVVTAGMFIGCGSSVSGIAPTEKVEMTAKEGQVKQADQVEGAQMPEDVPTAPAKAPAEAPKADNTEAPKTEKPKAETEKNTENKTAQAKPETSNQEKPAHNTAPKVDPQAPQPPSAPEPPAHEHVWQEHTTTRQEWVPNMVVVDDYETQTVVVGTAIQCNCGAVLSPEELETHSVNHIMNGEDDGHWGIEKTEQQQVKVGSHEEDHGHYETVIYVDYYYCDCGATK